MSPPGKKLARWLGLDFHILSTLMYRSWGIVSGAVMLLFMPVWFTSVEQGYYYTFASLLGLQIFFELGLNYVVMQQVSHEYAHVSRAADGSLQGDATHLDRLADLHAILRRWYRRAALAFWLVVGSVGTVFFSQRPDLTWTHWLPVWLTLVTVVSGNLYFSPMMAMLEGCGMVGQIARMRLKQAIVGSLLSWTLLSLGANLYAVPVLPTLGLIMTVIWLRRHGGILHQLQARAQGPMVHRLSWRTDIFPFQWRIALSWVSGYFIFQLFSPVLFAFRGPVEAGRVGMGLALFHALSTVGMSWVNAKAPQFGAHIARAERDALNRLFVTITQRSLAFITLGAFGILAGTRFLQHMQWPIAERLPDLAVLACLALVTIANTVVFAAAAYMRAHREEPMLVPSVTVGLLNLLAVTVGAQHSTWLPMVLYAALTLGVSLPWTAWLFLPYFRRTS